MSANTSALVTPIPWEGLDDRLCRWRVYEGRDGIAVELNGTVHVLDPFIAIQMSQALRTAVQAKATGPGMGGARWPVT